MGLRERVIVLRIELFALREGLLVLRVSLFRLRTSFPSAGEDFHTFYSAGGDKPSEFFGFTEDKNHQPNGTRIAFWADTRNEVDRMAKLVREAGGKALLGHERRRPVARPAAPARA